MASTQRPLTFAKIRLAVTALLFLGWVGWLGMQAANHTRPLIVSRSQALTMTDAVVAEVAADEQGKPRTTVKVVTSLVRFADTPDPTGQSITVIDLAEGRLPARYPFTPGQYLLMLRRTEAGEFRLAPIPRSPGYETGPLPIPYLYPWTDAVRDQFQAMKPSGS